MRRHEARREAQEAYFRRINDELNEAVVEWRLSFGGYGDSMTEQGTLPGARPGGRREE